MATLYRQYRPQRFADVSGQPHIVETLKAGIEHDRISHAYLFQGPRGCGKTSTARILAKRLNCLKAKNAEPCGKCTSCVAIQEGKSIDVIEIDAASNRGIDNIRSLRDTASLAPSMGKYKVYIIDEVHMLSHDAFPALLKTLEEPVGHVVFILATTELHKVPPTILSRCQVYRFRRATEEEMRQRLTFILKEEKRKADDAVVEFIISRSDGCYRDAESLLGQLLSMQDKKLTAEQLPSLLGLPSPTLVEDFLSALIRNDLAAALGYIDTIHEGGIDAEQFLQECIRTARDAIVKDVTNAKEVPVFAKGTGGKLTSAIRVFVQAIQDLAYVPQPHIALQLAAMTIATGGSGRAQAPAAPAPASVAAPIKKVVQKPVEAVVVTTATPQPASSGKGVSLQSVKGVWPELITMMKKTNPVASTFLRAVEPMNTEGSLITLKVSYPLHRSFFDKPEHKKMLEESLYELLREKVSIRCHMDSPAKTTKNGDQEIYNAVKEVFGNA